MTGASALIALTQLQTQYARRRDKWFIIAIAMLVAVWINLFYSGPEWLTIVLAVFHGGSFSWGCYNHYWCDKYGFIIRAIVKSLNRKGGPK